MADGSLGEQLSCEYLQKQGFRIVERNWRGGHLEVDIIAEGPDGLHFVEVKSRTAPVAAPLEAQVNANKRRKLENAALKYLNHKHLEGTEVFFDIISVVYDGGKTTIGYYPQAWIPMYY
ncbi:MAG: YraN family protein [Bacteroidales bacterium]|nr:YraN family protein [Bacteroidales bacterium]MBP5374013.1 YraN family protein [Bacteroidales bacterium]